MMIKVTNFQVNAKLFLIFLFICGVFSIYHVGESIKNSGYNGCIASHYDEWSNDKICDKFQPLHSFTLMGIFLILAGLCASILVLAYFIIMGVPDIE